MSEWIKVSSNPPPHNVPVETKITDSDGTRNVCVLRKFNHLWFFPDMSSYVYYEPTHWRPIQ